MLCMTLRGYQSNMARKVLTLRCAMLPARLPGDAQGAILWRGGGMVSARGRSFVLARFCKPECYTGPMIDEGLQRSLAL